MKADMMRRIFVSVLVGVVACSTAKAQVEEETPVWFGPAIGSVDMLQLFSDSATWETARSEIDVFQFLTHHVNSWPCFGSLCSTNVLSNLVAIQAFQRLEDWGIEIAIEGAGILPQTPFGSPANCALERQTAVQNAFNWTADAINNVYANGGTVDHIAIDEPIRRWYAPIYPPGQGPACQTDSLPLIAEMVASFITQMNSAAPWISIGQIILYPELDVDGIQEYVIALEQLGVTLDFVHLDVHGLRIIDYAGPVYGRVTLAQLRDDLQELKSFFAARSIPFAPILIDLSFTYQAFLFGEYTDEHYYEGAIDWIHQVDSAMGLPDRLVFESWARPQYIDTNLIHVTTPINLPENDTTVFSHTRLVNEGIAILRPPQSCCVGTTGNVDGSSDDVASLVDLIRLIDYLFISYTPLVCEAEADTDGSGDVGLPDLSRLIDHLFVSTSPTASCL